MADFNYCKYLPKEVKNKFQKYLKNKETLDRDVLERLLTRDEMEEVFEFLEKKCKTPDCMNNYILRIWSETTYVRAFSIINNKDYKKLLKTTSNNLKKTITGLRALIKAEISLPPHLYNLMDFNQETYKDLIEEEKNKSRKQQLEKELAKLKLANKHLITFTNVKLTQALEKLNNYIIKQSTIKPEFRWQSLIEGELPKNKEDPDSLSTLPLQTTLLLRKVSLLNQEYFKSKSHHITAIVTQVALGLPDFIQISTVSKAVKNIGN